MKMPPEFKKYLIKFYFDTKAWSGMIRYEEYAYLAQVEKELLEDSGEYQSWLDNFVKIAHYELSVELMEEMFPYIFGEKE